MSTEAIRSALAELVAAYSPGDEFFSLRGTRAWEAARAALAQRADEPVANSVLQLPPLTDIMYHAVRGSEYEFTSGGPESITGYMDDGMLDEIWDHINTALRIAQLGGK
jgi:hypothetical protein